MMYYPEKHSEEIKQCFGFLFKRGYSFRVIDEYEVAFFSQKCTLSIYSERYEEGFTVDVDFSEKFPAKESYSVPLIKRVIENDSEKHELPDNSEYLKTISEFVRENIEKLENEEFCKEMELEGEKILEKWAKENYSDLEGIVFDEQS